MFKFIKRLFSSEEISNDAIIHSSKGEYTSTKRLKSGGHGQEALDYMSKNRILYNVTKTYKNGVRVGNVPHHEKTKKRTGNNQSWFPKSWDRGIIKSAGKRIARGKKYPDGKIKKGRYKNVLIGIIRTKGKIATIFPLSKQRSKR